MIVHNGLHTFDQLPPSVVTSGTFDGVHFGHQKILHRLNEIGKDNELESVVLTFWPHPRFVLGKDSQNLKLISTLEEKIEHLRTYGLNRLVIIQFDEAFSQLSSKEFIMQILLEKVRTRKLVIGHDHRFGRNREGGFEYLKNNEEQFGFGVEEIPRQELEEVAVSSTRIREALEAGHIDEANNYLGRSYEFSGTVVQGDQIGRKLGFPTANLQVKESYKLIPADGTYAVSVGYQGKKWGGMLNIGLRPTLSGNRIKTIETHLFDFEGDLYEQTLTVYLIQRLRNEQKFQSLDELKAQLSLDEKAARQILNKKH